MKNVDNIGDMRMNYMEAAEKVLLFLLLANSVYTDIRKNRIPNAVTLFMTAAGILFLAVRGQLDQLPGRALAAACAVLFLYPLWRMKSLGAGDVKLFAALALFMQPADLMFCMGLAFVISLVPAAVQLLKGRGLKAKVHFAVPIALSACAVCLVPGLETGLRSLLGGW